MSVYVQGLSALAYYRNGSGRLGVETSSTHARALRDGTSSFRECIDAGVWRLGIGELTVERPLEVLVPDAARRTRSKAVVARVWKAPIARTAFRKVSRDIYVSSPEFVFLQMAVRLDLPELAALGMELCGTYRRAVEVPVLGTGETGYTTAYNQQPLTNPKRLAGFLASMQSTPGYARAKRALSYVLPYSASPMETALYLLLCLPRRVGGYGLPLPVLNPPIVLTKTGRRHTLRASAKPDLYWKRFLLDLEYNSEEFHDESRRAADSMRRKALERMGVEVIELTKEELLSTSLFHATVMRIARRMGKQLRPENEGDFPRKRELLRSMLLWEGDGSGAAEEAIDRTERDDPGLSDDELCHDEFFEDEGIDEFSPDLGDDEWWLDVQPDFSEAEIDWPVEWDEGGA